MQENGWEALSLQLLFRIFWLTEIYNLLDSFRVRIIEEIRLFFFDVEDPARDQKLCTVMM